MTIGESGAKFTCTPTFDEDAWLEDYKLLEAIYKDDAPQVIRKTPTPTANTPTIGQWCTLTHLETNALGVTSLVYNNTGDAVVFMVMNRKAGTHTEVI